MQRYSVKYIKRDGHVTEMTVRARDHHEAKRLASDAGCEDIIGVRAAGYSLSPVVVVLLIVAVLVVAYFFFVRAALSA